MLNELYVDKSTTLITPGYVEMFYEDENDELITISYLAGDIVELSVRRDAEEYAMRFKDGRFVQVSYHGSGADIVLRGDELKENGLVAKLRQEWNDPSDNRVGNRRELFMRESPLATVNMDAFAQLWLKEYNTYPSSIYAA